VLNWLIHRLHSVAPASCKAALAPSLLSKSATCPPDDGCGWGQRFLVQTFLPFVHGRLSHDRHLNIRCEICSWASRHAVIADLPPADTQRWVIRRKAEVVAAVQGGLLTCEEARDRYGLTAEEFSAWQASLHRYGLAGPKNQTPRLRSAAPSLRTRLKAFVLPAAAPPSYSPHQRPRHRRGGPLWQRTRLDGATGQGGIGSILKVVPVENTGEER